MDILSLYNQPLQFADTLTARRQLATALRQYHAINQRQQDLLAAHRAPEQALRAVNLARIQAKTNAQQAAAQLLALGILSIADYETVCKL